MTLAEDDSESIQIPERGSGAEADGQDSDVVPDELIEILPPPLRDAVRQAGGSQTAIRIVSAAFSASMHRGPLPPASEMKAYEEVLPGSANRILKMAEEQARHRQELEKIAVDGGGRRSWWGLWLGFSISVIVIVASVILVLKGHDAAGVTLGSIDLVALASVFVYGRIEQRKERGTKDAATQVDHPLPVSNPAQPIS